MKIVHLATFCGNSGDNVSHGGFHSMLKELYNEDINFIEIELRDFYKNAQLRKFDNEFLQLINSADLLVIGGGQFFDVRWSYSHTGTTLDWSDDFINGINVPVIFNGVGYARASEKSISKLEMQDICNKFKKFAEKLFEKNWLITLRNDGSVNRIKQDYGNELASKFKLVPDNGFYFDKTIKPYAFEKHMPTIGINLANDSFDQSEQNTEFIKNFNLEIAKTIEHYANQNYRIILLPHIPRDLQAIHEIQTLLPERIFRFHVCIAPYNPQDIFAAQTLIAYYKACDVVLTMRLHANIIALQNAIPCLGLAVKGIVSPERIKALYNFMNLQDYCLEITDNSNKISETLVKQIDARLQNSEPYKNIVAHSMQNLYEMKKNYLNEIETFIK